MQTGRVTGLTRCPFWGHPTSEGWQGTGPPPRHRPRGTDTCHPWGDADFPHRFYGAGRAGVTQRPPPAVGFWDRDGAEPFRSPCPAVPGVTGIVSWVGAQQRVGG